MNRNTTILCSVLLLTVFVFYVIYIDHDEVIHSSTIDYIVGIARKRQIAQKILPQEAYKLNIYESCLMFYGPELIACIIDSYRDFLEYDFTFEFEKRHCNRKLIPDTKYESCIVYPFNQSRYIDCICN